MVEVVKAHHGNEESEANKKDLYPGTFLHMETAYQHLVGDASLIPAAGSLCYMTLCAEAPLSCFQCHESYPSTLAIVRTP